jgi:ABC-type sulfate/molybdate transport systems ATPase subunit
MLFQDLALWPNLSVTGNLRLGLSGLHLEREELSSRIAKMAKLCGIEELAKRQPGTLSGGQQQRVALARALVMQPKLLLLDEPFGGLDLLTKETIIREIHRLKSLLGFSLVLVTHDPLEVAELCNSLAVLEDGRIVDREPIDEVAENVKSPLTRAFIKQLHQAKSEQRH